MREQATAAPDELALELQIRRRYKQNWPKVILELTKRVTSVNTTWGQVVNALMQINGLRISWYQRSTGDGIVVEVRYIEEVETHFIPATELMDAQRYIEVLLMDKLDHSKLMHKAIKAHNATINHKPELPG